MKALFNFVFLILMCILGCYLALDFVIHATRSMCSAFTPTPSFALSTFLPMFMEGAGVCAIGYMLIELCDDGIKKVRGQQ